MKINKLLSIFKSIYLNFRIFNYKTAIKLPILVSYNTKLVGLKKDSIVVDNSIGVGGIRIGFGGIDIVQENRESIIDNGGRIVFNGRAQFS